MGSTVEERTGIIVLKTGQMKRKDRHVSGIRELLSARKAEVHIVNLCFFLYWARACEGRHHLLFCPVILVRRVIRVSFSFSERLSVMPWPHWER